MLAIAGAALAYGPPQAWRAAYDLFWILCGFPLLVVGAAHVEPRRSAAVFGLLGTVSYPAYIIHYPLQRLIRDVVRYEHADVTGFAPMSGLMLIAVLVPLSWALAKYYDAPVRRWLSALGGRRLAPSRVPASEERIG